jgi:DNA ligase (NAD+)
MNLIEETVKKLIEAKDYYYSGEPIISDEEFDNLEDELRRIDPTNSYFDLVGVSASKEKVKHSIPMLSCDKVKTVEGIINWIKKMNIMGEDLVIEPKIDGISCSMIYNNGFIKRVATRGDGLIGQDISHIWKFMNIPTTISRREKIEVRGELYLPKNSEFPNPDNKPLRNIAFGIVNRKDSGLDDLKFVKFIAYQLYGSSLIQEEEKLSELEYIGFTAVPYWVVSSDKDKYIKLYSDLYLSKYRDEWEFQTDGLVFVVNNNNLWDQLDSKYTATNHHYYNIALKPPSVSKETILEGIEWNVSRLGKVIPTAIVKPVVIGGSTITRCSLSNVENVEKLRLQTGDRIEIERANDVIPYFKSNKENHPVDHWIIPNTCPSCQGALYREGPHLICSNTDCQERIIMEILHWIQKSEMDGISESFVRKLVESKRIFLVKDLYKLEEKDFEGIEGFGDRKIEIALKEIEKSRIMSVRQFLERLGINGVGKKAIEKLNINTVDDIFHFESDGSFIGDSLQSFVDLNERFISELLVIVKVYNEASKSNSSSLGKVCMTGTGPKGRKELTDQLNKMGYVFVSSVSKDTNILVCEDVNGLSDKLKRANKLGVKIMSYEEFFRKESK